MRPERWAQVERLYHEALAQPSIQRESFLARACGSDDALRQEVEGMLVADAGAEGFLEAPAFEAAARALPLAAALCPGTRLGPYEILSLIGTGGMGEVYKARDVRLGRLVAVKVMRPYPLGNGDRRKRLLREARAASALSHPNIVPLHDIFSDGERDALVMDYVEGQTLDTILTHERMQTPEVLQYAIQIADALGAAHAAGIVHRDVKPGNIMITDGPGHGTAKVLDFGVAKMEDGLQSADGNPSFTAEGTIVGTVAYMSPEQASGRCVDARSDIFSFAVVLYEMVSGHPPFAGSSSLAVLERIVHHDPEPLGEDVPAPLRWALQKALEKDPADRYQSIQELGVDLRRMRREVDTRGTSSQPAAPTAGRKALPWLVASILVIVTAIWQVMKPEGAPEPLLVNAKFSRLTDFEASEFGAAVSPDGRWVVFRSDRDGPGDVWLTQVGTGRFTNVTQGKVDVFKYPMRTVGFSADGSEIWWLGVPDSRLHLMPLMGGQSRVFLGETTVNAAWSPDGTQIVYHTTDSGDPMFLADRTGATPRKIFTGPYAGWHSHYQVWSPDARWIYFAGGRATANEMDLWRIPANGGTAERLTRHRGDVAYPAPIDNRIVLYVARDQDGSGPWLWALDVERKRTRRVSFGLEQYTSIAATMDGRRLVATVANPTASLWTVPITDHVAGEEEVRPFAAGRVNARSPRFGPGFLFFLSSRGSADGLWRYKDGQAFETWNGSEGALLESPAVSPDGRRAAILLRRDGTRRLHIVSADGAENQPVASTIEVVGSPCWSPDGQWLVTGGEDGSGPGLFKVPVAGGNAVRMVDGPALNPVWSRQQDLIVYAGPEVGGSMPLVAMKPDGTRVELPHIEVRGWGERVRFTPDGAALVYMQGMRRAQDFWLLELATGKSRQLTRFQDRAEMRTFDLTGDGRSIVFDRLWDNSDLVLIDLPATTQR